MILQEYLSKRPFAIMSSQARLCQERLSAQLGATTFFIVSGIQRITLAISNLSTSGSAMGKSDPVLQPTLDAVRLGKA